MIDWLWDTHHLDPDLLNTEDEMGQGQQMEQAQMMGQLMQGIGAPAADMMSKGAGAVKQLSDAQASGGIDLNQIAPGAENVTQLPQFRQAIGQ